MDILKSIVFGIIEGITEWLPISSTGHLIIFDYLIPMNVSAEFYDLYQVVIQLGAVMAVVVLFWDKVWPFGKTEHPLADVPVLRYVRKNIFILWLKAFIACIPAIIVGLLFMDWIDAHFYNPLCVALALIVVGIAFIVVEVMYKDRKPKIQRFSQIGFDTAFYIGLFQVLAAIFPGTSRSGATIIGALILGISRGTSSEFTFFLSIPVMLGASLLKIFKIGVIISFYEFIILFVGCLTAFVVSLFAIRLLLSYVRKNNFIIFGIYRIILGVIILIFLM